MLTTHAPQPDKQPTQDVARLRQLAAVRGLVSTELRARLWPVLLGGCGAGGGSEAHASAPQPSSHPLSRRSSVEGRALSPSWPSSTTAAAVASAAASETACSALIEHSSGGGGGGDYEQWASGTHKDTNTVGWAGVLLVP